MRRQRKRSIKLLALISAFSLIAAACGDDSDDSDSDTEAEPGEEAAEREPSGGELVLIAEQWPECLNPESACSNAAWLTWSVLMHTLPRLMEVDTDGSTYIPLPVLDGEPELSGEGVDDSGEPFTTTFHISEDAVWDDGTPITSTDLRFTWLARMNTTGAVGLTGYAEIADIDDSDPKTAVITWTEPYADWHDTMGGDTEFFIKADEEYFGEDIVSSDEPDIADFMVDEVPFSAAPWVLESWSLQELTLVPNENYWVEERLPLVDQVTMIPAESTEGELVALRSGVAMAANVQPSPGITDEVGDLALEYEYGTSWEAIWFNHGSLLNEDSVLHEPEVREALLYAINRDQILEEIMEPDLPDIEPLNCAGWVATVGDWCNAEDYGDVEYDPDHAAEVLEAEGWELGSDGIYERDGQRLSMTWQTTEGNQRREDIQGLIIPQLEEVGIEVATDNDEGGTLFQTRFPQLDTEMTLYAWVTGPDPSVSDWAHCSEVPSEENDFSGQNNIAWCNEEASDLMTASDEAVDPDERLDLMHQVGAHMREDVISLPLYQLPAILVFDDEVVEGVTEDTMGEYLLGPYQGFGNIYDWRLVG